jgi:glycosyltransferase involved in cell wall biosynthesis
MKVLSVVVPAYNVGKYIQRCLDSLVYDEKNIKDLDIVVVNDGSSDNTREIAEKYASKYPGSIKVINKRNGGHGSAINAGLKVAKGRYVKILDGDDWFNVFDLSMMVKKLSKEKVDVVVTNYKRVLLYNESEIYFDFSSGNDDKIHKIVDAAGQIKNTDFFFKFSMPSMAIRTKTLMGNWGDGLPEKKFYVDQLFVAKVIISAKTYTIYSDDIYRHFIGRPEQSIGSEGFYKHRLDHEYVLKRLLKIYAEIENEEKREILGEQIILMINTQYQIYKYKKGSLTKEDRRELLEFDKFLKNNYVDVYNKKTVGVNIFGRIK